MTENVGWKDNVYREKSLWQVLRASQVLSASQFNRRAMRVGCVLAVIYVIGNYIGGVENQRVLDATARVASALLTVTTAILGFLVTGFSIFVASTDPRTFKALEETRYKDTEISYFKEVMFNFLNVFTVYLTVLSISLVLYVCNPLGWWPPLMPLEKKLHCVIPLFNSVVLAFACVAGLYSILRLKSFIWQLYQSLLIAMNIRRLLTEDPRGGARE